MIVWFFVFEIKRGCENRYVNENKTIIVNGTKKIATTMANPMKLTMAAAEKKVRLVNVQCIFPLSKC